MGPRVDRLSALLFADAKWLLRHDKIEIRTLSRMRNASIAFLALGIALIAVGLSGQHTFIYVGVAFLIVALLRLRRRR